MSTRQFILKFDKTIETFSRWLDYCARFFTFIIMIIVSANAILNNLWKPIYGSYEYAQLGTVLILSLCLAYCGIEGGHVFVTFLTDFFPKKIERIIILVNNIIAIGISWFIAVYAWRQAMYAFKVNDSINTIFVPKGPFIICIGIGFFILGFAYIVRFLRLLRYCDEDSGESKKAEGKVVV